MAELFSVRMRASSGGRHISGAERIVQSDEIEAVTASLVRRALTHENGLPRDINIAVESLAGKAILELKPLSIKSPPVLTIPLSHALAISELIIAGVSETAAKMALKAILSGASSDGGNMRGAMLVDAKTGERLEPDRARGIRARAVDWAKEAEHCISQAERELNCSTSHFREALALATKAANAPGAVAELCVSDDPNYTTGYVAYLANGYCRITPIKAIGEAFGGRAFFIDTEKFNMQKYIEYMQETPVLINGEIKCSNIHVP